jgi:hypothetical protein
MDLQTLIVAMIIAAAGLYLASRAVRRLGTFSLSRSSAASCETGCGRCEGARPAPAVPPLVRIERAGLSTRRPART